MRTRIVRRYPSILVLALLVVAALAGASGAAQPCPDGCDCDSEDGNSDNLYGTDIVLGLAPVEKCPLLDLDHDGTVTVTELVAWHKGEAAVPAVRSSAATGEVTITVGVPKGLPGTNVIAPVLIDSGGLAVAGMQTDIAFDPLTPIDFCRFPPTAFIAASAFQPPFCARGVNCTAIRSIIIDIDRPFPDGLLFECFISIDSAAPLGTYPLTQSLVITSSRFGDRLPTTWVDGAAVVVASDSDSDGDDNLDGDDNCPNKFNPDQADGDGDLFGDACDTCPEIFDPDQTDVDGDRAGDVCDICPTAFDYNQADLDDDGLGDACDNCYYYFNPDQEDLDGDLTGDLCDNCPTDSNVDQADNDFDSVGNVCDNCPAHSNYFQDDFDRDGAGNPCDNCPIVSNPDQADRDGDQVGDLCDPVDDSELIVRSAWLRPDTSGIGRVGFAKILASLNRARVGDRLETDLIAGGLLVTVRDSGAFEAELLFDRCERRGTSRIRCRGGQDGLAFFVMRRRGPGYEMRVTGRRLLHTETGSGAPTGPVEVIVGAAAVEHSATISSCRRGRHDSLACTSP